MHAGLVELFQVAADVLRPPADPWRARAEAAEARVRSLEPLAWRCCMNDLHRRLMREERPRDPWLVKFNSLTVCHRSRQASKFQKGNGRWNKKTRTTWAQSIACMVRSAFNRVNYRNRQDQDPWIGWARRKVSAWRSRTRRVSGQIRPDS